MGENRAIICPKCRRLISNYVEQCPHCGLSKPGDRAWFMRTLGGNHISFVNGIIAVNIAFFVASYLLPLFFSSNMMTSRGMFGLPAPSGFALDQLGGAHLTGVFSGEWWRLVNSTFLHGGPLHILFNMIWVKNLGTPAEQLLSPQKMVVVYLISGVVGNMAAIFLPVAGFYLGFTLRPVFVIGASGAVFGLMGAIIAYGRKRGGYLGRSLVRQLGMWAAIIIVMGFIIPGISNSAHIGGLIAGLVLGQIMPIQDNFAGRQLHIILSLIVISVCIYSFFKVLQQLVAIL